MLLRYAILAAGLFFAGNYFHFDDFSSVMLALCGIFLAEFARTSSRYWRRVGVGRAGERLIQRTLTELGVKAIHDLHLPVQSGSMQIDHVALFPGSLVVLETKTYNGRLNMSSGGHWNRIGRRGACYRISNPLWQLEAAKAAISAALPGVHVWGFVVLAGAYTTTTGHPSNVVSTDGLRNYITDHRRRHGEWRYSDKIGEAWKRLNALKSEYAPLEKTHIRDARKKRGDRFYNFEEIWPLCLWGSLAAEAGILCLLARYHII